MERSVIWLYSWTVALLFTETSALYFFLNEGEEKCFLQELADETLVVGMKLAVFVPSLMKKIASLTFSPRAGLLLSQTKYRCIVASMKDATDDPNREERGMMVEIQDPQKKTVLSRWYRREGRFSYKSHKPGVHTICLHTKSKHPLKEKIKIHFDLQVGEQEINNSTKNLHLTNIEQRYQQLVEKAAAINKELDYLRYREEMFRDTTETISRRVLLWMIGETVLVVIIAIWQLENLRKFFESKKLV